MEGEPGLRAREVGRGQVPPARPPTRGHRSQMLGSLFGKTGTRAYISMGRKLFYFYFFYGDEGRGIIPPDAITPRK